MKRATLTTLALIFALWTPALAPADPSAPQKAKADAMLQKAVAYLRTKQDPATGGWSVPPPGRGQPNLPAITGLVLSGMLLDPAADQGDPSITAGVKYILSFAHPDGGIYDTMLPSYNTAICLSALARVNTPEAKAAIKPAQDFLRNQQWGTKTPVGMKSPGNFGTEAPAMVDESSPFYGGVGYGNSSRPDLSNLAFAIQAWHDSGLPPDDEAFQRALVFLQRVQMQEVGPGGKVINDQPYAKGSRQGGFIYSTGTSDKAAGQGESKAGTIEETMDDGTRVSRLRSYGSMTYSGFKSFLYAGLSPSDPRVQSALAWIQDNYTVVENPGIGADGYYYFLIAMARALDAAGADTLRVTRFADGRDTVWIEGLPAGQSLSDLRAQFPTLAKAGGLVPAAASTPASGIDSMTLAYFAKENDAQAAAAALNNAPFAGKTLRAGLVRGDATPGPRNWRDDLIDQLARLQNDDGSFRPVDPRWMEDNPVLITAYSVIALQHARK